MANELSGIVNQIRRELSEVGSNFFNFRNEAKLNDNKLFDITKDAYNAIKNNKKTIDDVREDFSNLRDKHNEIKEKTISVERNLNQVISNQRDIAKKVDQTNTEFAKFRRNIITNFSNINAIINDVVLSQRRQQEQAQPEPLRVEVPKSAYQKEDAYRRSLLDRMLDYGVYRGFGGGLGGTGGSGGTRGLGPIAPGGAPSIFPRSPTATPPIPSPPITSQPRSPVVTPPTTSPPPSSSSNTRGIATPPPISDQPYSGDSKEPTKIKIRGRKIDEQSFFDRAVQKIRNSKLNGFVPKDGARFGITTGSPQEWARLYTMLLKQESGGRIAQVGPDGRLIKFRTTPAGEKSYGPLQFNIGEYGLKSWSDVNNPDRNIDALIKVGERWTLKSGVISGRGRGQGYYSGWGGYSAYFGSLRRPNETLQHSKWFQRNIKVKSQEQTQQPQQQPQVRVENKVNKNIGYKIEDDLSPAKFYTGKDTWNRKIVTGGGRSFNPGNLKFSNSKWQQRELSRYSMSGKLTRSEQKDEGTPQIMFRNPAAGAAGATRLAMLYSTSGVRTLREYIRKYTPGDRGAHLASIAKTSGLNPDEKIDFKNPEVMYRLQRAVFIHEVGPHTYEKMGGDAMTRAGVMTAFKNSYEQVYKTKLPESVNQYFSGKKNQDQNKFDSKDQKLGLAKSKGGFYFPLGPHTMLHKGHGRTSEFGYGRGRLHAGVDLYALDPETGKLQIGKEAPVFSPFDGTIVSIKMNKSGASSGTGNSVVIKNKNGTYSRYFHLGPNMAINPKTGKPFKFGDKIEAGTLFQYVGGTGTHFGRAVYDRMLRAQRRNRPISYQQALEEQIEYYNKNGWGSVNKPHLHFELTQRPGGIGAGAGAFDPAKFFPEYSASQKGKIIGLLQKRKNETEEEFKKRIEKYKIGNLGGPMPEKTSEDPNDLLIRKKQQENIFKETVRREISNYFDPERELIEQAKIKQKADKELKEGNLGGSMDDKDIDPKKIKTESQILKEINEARRKVEQEEKEQERKEREGIALDVDGPPKETPQQRVKSRETTPPRYRPPNVRGYVSPRGNTTDRVVGSTDDSSPGYPEWAKKALRIDPQYADGS